MIVNFLNFAKTSSPSQKHQFTYYVTIIFILNKGDNYLTRVLSLIAATEPVTPSSRFSFLSQIDVVMASYPNPLSILIIRYKILQQEKNIIVMIHTFSPNWYKQQCLLFDGNTLYYASNYVLYKYNLEQRKVQADRCFRKVAIKSGMNSKDIKIHTIKKLNQQTLIIGTNQSDAVIVNAQNLNVVSIVRNIGLNSTHLCSTGAQQEKFYALFTDQNGELSKIIFSNPHQFVIQKQTYELLPKEKIKQILNLSKMGLIVYGKGHMILFDEKFNKVIQQISPSKIGLEQDSVLSIDTLQENQILWACMLTRNKLNEVLIHFWSIVVGQQNGKYELVFKKIVKSQIKIIYPKVMNQKLKNVQKAAMTIKFLNSSYLLVTGKLGQIFILNLHILPETVTIKPQSIDDLPPYIQILNDSKHYKEIYAIYIHKRPKYNVKQLFTISTDQTMNVWKIIDKSIQSNYSIKFITSQVASIFYCEADPKTVFFLLKDSNIRSVTPLSTQNYFLNQYWKFTKKFKILKAVTHLQEPGVCAMVTECGKIIVYDLFDDRLMKLYDLQVKNPKDEIINISFEYNTIMEPIHKLTQKIQPDIQNQWKIQKLKTTTYHTKVIKNSGQIGILVQQKNRLWYIHQGQDHDIVMCIKRTLRIQRIHNTKLWDNNSILFSQSKNNILKLWFFYKGRVLNIQFPLKIGGRCIFKIDPLCLRVFQFKGKKVLIYTFSIEQQLKNINQLEFQLPLHTQQAVVDYHSNQVIFYNGKDDMFVLLQFSNIGGRVNMFDTGNKIQNLTFYLKEYVVIGFKDQSIKILRIADLIYIKDQPQKRVKKHIESKEQSMIDEKIEIKQTDNMMSLQE